MSALAPPALRTLFLNPLARPTLAVAGVGLLDQQNSFIGKVLLHICVFAILLVRTTSDIDKYKNLIDEVGRGTAWEGCRASLGAGTAGTFLASWGGSAGGRMSSILVLHCSCAPWQLLTWAPSPHVPLACRPPSTTSSGTRRGRARSGRLTTKLCCPPLTPPTPPPPDD